MYKDEDINAAIVFGAVCTAIVAGVVIYKVHSSPQEIITKYKKDPICVESEVGKDTIKRCYTLVEVK